MTYRLGQVVSGQAESYHYGHVKKVKKRWPRVLAIFALLVSLPCGGVWLASNNFAIQPEQVSAATDTVSQPEPVVEEPEQLPQTGPGSETNAEVQRFLHEWIQTNGKDRWGVYVEQIGQNRQIASVNADRQFELASLYKLFIPSVLATQVPIGEWAKTRTSNEEGRTIDRCVTDMLRVSDNTCGEALAARVSWSALDKYAQTSGYVFTHLNTTDYLKGTSRDTAALLKDLQAGRGFDPAVKDKMLSVMKEQRYNRGIPAGCQGCVVYNKTGDMNGSRHDAAIIEYEGKTYVLVIMSKGGSYQKIADLTQGILSKFKVPTSAQPATNTNSSSSPVLQQATH